MVVLRVFFIVWQNHLCFQRRCFRQQVLGWCAGIFLLVASESVYAKQTIPIAGTLNAADKTLSVEIGHGQPFYFEVTKTADSGYELRLTVTNWATPFFDLSTVLNGSLVIQPALEGGGLQLSGRLRSRYTLLNQLPFEELNVAFSLIGGRLVIDTLTVGPFVCSGEVVLGPSPSMNLTLQFQSVSLAHLSEIFYRNSDIDMQGDVTGEVQLQGPLDQLQVKGRVVSYQGFVGRYGYNAAQISFSGIYPFVYIDDSQITQEDGLSFNIQGTLDLTDLKNLKKQLERFIGSPLVSRQGENLEWTFKRLHSPQKPGTTEFKYMLKKDDPSGEAANIFGVQRRMEF